MPSRRPRRWHLSPLSSLTPSFLPSFLFSSSVSMFARRFALERYFKDLLTLLEPRIVPGSGQTFYWKGLPIGPIR